MVSTATKRRADSFDHSPLKKRACGSSCRAAVCDGTQNFHAPAAQDPPALFLEQLGLGPGPAGGLNDLLWRCFAEFNLLLREKASQLRDMPLCGYVSYTRCQKEEVFQKLLASEGAPLHVQQIGAILQHTMAAVREASICRYTVQRPDWMLQWCAAWGFAAPRISLFAVNAYSCDDSPMHVHGGELCVGRREELCNTLFVPVVSAS